MNILCMAFICVPVGLIGFGLAAVFFKKAIEAIRYKVWGEYEPKWGLGAIWTGLGLLSLWTTGVAIGVIVSALEWVAGNLKQ